MKRHWITTFVTLFVLTLLAGTLVAKEAKDRPNKPEGRKRAGRRPGRAGRMPDIGLTDAQKKEIEGIRKDAMAKIKGAEPEQRRAIFKKMREDIHGVFTKEQIEKLKKARQQDGPGRKRPDLGLTDEQKKEMARIRKEAMAKVKDAKPEERKAIFEGMRAEIEKLLTKEQLEKFKKARQGGQHRRGMPDIGLSDDQKAQIETIRKKALAEAKGAKGEARKGIIEQMKKDIHALLSEEQLEKLKKAHQDRPRRGEGKGRGRGDKKGRKGGGDGPPKKRPASE